MTRYADITQTIGRTPVVRINRLAPEGVNVWAKLEAFNPLGSVKDRLALGVIEAAEASGALKPGQTVVEATSGNTGIGLAMVCAQRGYPLVVVMADSFSVERRKLMRFLGAKVVLTPAALRAVGMIDKVRELTAAHGWFWARQFENEANADKHSQTTAVEIIEDFKDIGLDYWVTGYGTGGTLRGVSRVLAKESPRTQIIVCEPESAPLLGSHQPQARHPDGTPTTGHPAWNPHPMQGWTPDFIAQLLQEAVDTDVIRAILPILRHHIRRDLRRGAAGGGHRAQGLQHPLHAARHGRAVPLDAVVRRRAGGDDRGRGGHLRLDAVGRQLRVSGVT